MFFNLFNPLPRPYEMGYLPDKDGHQIFYQQFGNPNGRVILTFHGGPGGCGKPKHVIHYNLKKYRVIVFDQRGCGRSLAKDIYYKNETKYLINDANRLLEYLKIKGKVVIGGGSWGSTLALIFAQTYPDKVSKLVLNSIFLADDTANNWMPQTSRLFYPDFIDLFRQQAGSQNIRDYFGRMILSRDRKKQEFALASYAGYERLLGATHPKLPTPPFTENDYQYPRLFFHYDVHDYFMRPNQILNNAYKINHIPTLIFHNRLDMSCPLCGAWDLHKALPKSKLFIIPSHGHGSKLMFDTMKQELKTFLK